MKLFQRAMIGNLMLINRIVMSPMGTGGIIDPSGRFSQRAIDYYVARARGGAGLLISGMTRVETQIEERRESPFSTQPRADGYLFGCGLGELADAVHDYGAKMFIQLTAGFGRVVAPVTLRHKPVAPSVLPCFRNPDLMTRALDTEEVESLVRAFGFAAKVVHDSGIDGVMLHGHEGYLLDQFTTELWNKRTDKYGGSFRKRLTFPAEVVQSIKSAAGRDFPVVYQMALTHYLEGGREAEESINMAKHLEDMGVDAFLVDNGCYETWYWAHPPIYQPPGCMVDAAETIKSEVKVPIIAVGKLGYPELAESIIDEGKADLVALGRPLLADPDWPNKVRAGRWEEIRPCIGCHEGCLRRIVLGSYISCAINPVTGNERELSLRPAEMSKSLLVIGGGPGGMEAARIAAQRGHRVTLWEKMPNLGGNLNAASAPGFKKDMRLFKEYLIRQITKNGVEVVMSKEATPESVSEENADIVIIATGSSCATLDIPGAKKESVLSASDALMGDSMSGTSALVIGGGTVGCEVAVYLAERGQKVAVVEKLDHLADGLFEANAQQLVKMVGDSGIEVLTGSEIKEVTSNGVIIVNKEGKETIVKADTIVNATGFEPNCSLFEALRSKLPRVYAIGDCVEPRQVMSAVWEAYRLARLI